MKKIILWDKGAPYFDSSLGQDEPRMDAYLIEDGCIHPSIIVCPGGGFNSRADSYEGDDIAVFLNENGVSAFVLRYRFNPYLYPVPLLDVKRAVRTARYRHSEFMIDPDKIGVMGFSAGGHLSVLALEQFDRGIDSGDCIDRISSRPDFGVLCYPSVTIGTEHSHIGCGDMLLGDKMIKDRNLIDSISGEKNVPENCAPVFIWHGADDDCVNVLESVSLAAELSRKKIPYEMHIFEHASHGLGLAIGHSEAGQWPGLMLNWLNKCVLK